MSNPRYSNGARRRAIRARLMAGDGVCAICGRAIDRCLKTPHPMSPEVDEIVPVSKGGDPLDIRNCRLVHRICNQRRGNRADGAPVPAPVDHSRDWRRIGR